MNKWFLGAGSLIVLGAFSYNAFTQSAPKPAAPAAPSAAAEACKHCALTTTWQSFVTAKQVKEQLDQPNVLVIDVRSPAKYAAGHIPGAINVPGDLWRTPAQKASKGGSQDVFVKADGSPDVAKYEQFLGSYGIRNDHKVITYGEHAGKADGTVPAMILRWLGNPSVAFLDGVGVNQWTAAGYELAKEPRKLETSVYAATAEPNFLWGTKDVLARLNDTGVVFYDTRSPKEFSGEDKRDNQRGGHIPGAVLCDYEEFLDKTTRTALPPDQIRKILEAKKITPDKQVVLYCQTATRVSLPYLALKDLGYKNVAVYDTSWHEYGNREDTPVALPQGK